MGFFAWTTLLAPLLAAVLLTIRPKLRRSAAAPYVATATVFFTLAVALSFWLGDVKGVSTFPWLDLRGADGKGLLVELGVLVDPLSKLMLLVVGGVGSAIFVFALGYMHGDPSIGRFYAKFALFVFSMLGIVLANNFLMIFVFWELVGASSYLLIGYYYDRPSAVEAGKKAFLTNRVADFGFLLGILLVWKMTGSFRFDEIEQAVRGGELADEPVWLLALAAFLVFLGAAGKSAQLPFHVWLPDAMEGPTPVSALMHAATMVAAGVYMVIRVFFCFGPAGGVDWGWAPDFIACTGGATAILAATIALVQKDIKKVLAYSTLSQLGYMVMALGAGAYGIAMFHLTTHAFFKGLLFLCAGSVIHGCHHEQDMFRMGGLRTRMPLTFLAYTIGMLALTGIPPFAGFWSKDLILDALHERGFHGLHLLGSVTAGLTALYMGRSWILTFFGGYRGHAEPHESPRVMIFPLLFLAACSVAVGLPYGRVQEYLGRWQGKLHEPLHLHLNFVLLGIVLLGYALAYAHYGRGWGAAERMKRRFRHLHALLENRYYIDDFYLWLVRGVQQGVARLCRLFEEKVVVGAAVGGVTEGTRLAGDRLRRLQSGRLNFYAYLFLGGVVVLYLVLVLR